MRKRILLAALLGTGLLCSPGYAAEKDKLQAAISTQDAVEKAEQVSQDKIDKLADQTDQMLTEYKLAIRQYQTLKEYNDHIERIVASQEAELVSMEQQLASIEDTNRGVIPLMARMLDTLEQFVQLDLPFLLKEREKRVAELKELMDRADVTVSEKYRRLMEAYQIENEYGRTIEAYRDVLTDGSSERSVEFLRIGRVGLYYQTLDGKETATWDRASKSWKILSEEFRKPVRQGLQIARKQAAPDLLKLPVAAPERL